MHAIASKGGVLVDMQKGCVNALMSLPRHPKYHNAGRLGKGATQL